jgi:hypothetical protein
MQVPVARIQIIKAAAPLKTKRSSRLPRKRREQRSELALVAHP